MKKWSLLLAAAALVAGVSANAANVASTGEGVGILNDTFDVTCGTLLFNADGTYENGYAWQYGGIVAPQYGAFAEKYDSVGLMVCSIVMDLTQVGNDVGQTCDLYAWEDAGGLPGLVLGVATGYNPSTIAFWPSLSRHTGAITAECSSSSATWVGYWANWPNAVAGWYVGADQDGFGGYPYTNIAPGIGYPTGWNNVSIVWGPTQAIGLGAEFVTCPDVPIENKTWGQIKSLYQ
ncbi:MAG: hypothetical protein R3E97_02515 [Candidatus Eisenbacteria bacterium]